ncbi:hypothetical protein B4168_0028 [Anoxybacillus flavithermus]|nr:hypothetical protein B4168_0028 [Anoxybacillus flavithermus]
MILSGMPMFPTSPHQRFFYIYFDVYYMKNGAKRLMNHFF